MKHVPDHEIIKEIARIRQIPEEQVYRYALEQCLHAAFCDQVGLMKTHKCFGENLEDE